MKPRSVLVVIAAVALAAGAGALGILRGPDPAFTVNGEEWSREQVGRVMDSLVAAGQFPSVEGRITSDSLSAVMSVLVQYRAGRQLLAERGVQVTAADIAAARTNIAGRFADPYVVDVLSDMSATGATLDRLPAPSDVESIYGRNPALTGVLCAVDIAAADEDSALATVRALDGGADPLELAARTARGSEFEATDGLVAVSTDRPCATLSWVKDRVSRTVFGALVTTEAGGHSVAVRDPSGWHVVVNLPWEAVSATHTRMFAESPGRNLAAGFAATSSVTVSPEYGTWNPATLTIE